MSTVTISDIVARIERAAADGRLCPILAPCAVRRIAQIERLAAGRWLTGEAAQRLALEAEALAFAFPPLPVAEEA